MDSVGFGCVLIDDHRNGSTLQGNVPRPRSTGNCIGAEQGRWVTQRSSMTTVLLQMSV